MSRWAFTDSGTQSCEGSSEGHFYTPCPHIGIALALLFIGRVTYKLIHKYMLTSSYTQSPAEIVESHDALHHRHSRRLLRDLCLWPPALAAYRRCANDRYRHPVERSLTPCSSGLPSAVAERKRRASRVRDVLTESNRRKLPIWTITASDRQENLGHISTHFPATYSTLWPRRWQVTSPRNTC